MTRPATGSRIPCPECGSLRSKVKDTIAWQSSIRRRRECDKKHRWWTVEIVERSPRPA